ncbi:MAG: hypothetical protein ACI4JF_05060 [Oscillospiraceae bacterium]
MTLYGEHQKISIEITGYEFSEPRGNYWDDNWLTIHGETEINGTVISGEASCFFVSELALLLKKLSAYKSGEVSEFGWNGTDINLEITFSAGGVLEIFFCPENYEKSWDNIVPFRKSLESTDIDTLIEFCIDGMKKYPQR